MADNANNNETIKALNFLIGTAIDGENGYREAAEEAESSELKSVLVQRGQQRAKFRSELQAEVERLGGDPKESGSAGAALHRAWLNVRDAISGKGDDAIISESERGEKAALDNYQDVLGRDLPGDIKTLVARQQSEIQDAYGQLEAHKGSA
jgi:uncharacterized protein (TIGR02284 family)